MSDLLATLYVLALTTGHRARQLARRVTRSGVDRDAGLSTLEVVVLALGLFLIAGVLVAAITAAVNNRLGQLA
jgi:hypothetical protein